MLEKETYWSKFANDFEERNNVVVGSDMKLIFEKVKTLTNLKDCLELGCGNGTYSKILSKHANHVLATDFSEEMVAEAKKRLANCKNIQVEQANCHNLQYDSNRFDTVFMANLLHIVPQPQKAINEACRVTKENGKLIVISFTSENMTFMNKLGMIYRYIRNYGKPSPYAYTLTLKNAEEMLTKAGFKVETSELIGKKMKAVFLVGRPKEKCSIK